ncbi:unnamed protein product, partial [Brachionus calyciflorus]
TVSGAEYVGEGYIPNVNNRRRGSPKLT